MQDGLGGRNRRNLAKGRGQRHSDCVWLSYMVELDNRSARQQKFPGPGFLLLTRNHGVFEWCLSCELKLVFQMTLMTTGLYNEAGGAYLPFDSVLDPA
jgi:hypothetical protein